MNPMCGEKIIITAIFWRNASEWTGNSRIKTWEQKREVVKAVFVREITLRNGKVVRKRNRYRWFPRKAVKAVQVVIDGRLRFVPEGEWKPAKQKRKPEKKVQDNQMVLGWEEDNAI